MDMGLFGITFPKIYLITSSEISLLILIKLFFILNPLYKHHFLFWILNSSAIYLVKLFLSDQEISLISFNKNLLVPRRLEHKIANSTVDEY